MVTFKSRHYFIRGVVIRRWQPVKLVELTVAVVMFLSYRESEQANLELLLLSNHINVHNEQKRGVVITDEMVGKLNKEVCHYHHVIYFTIRDKTMSNIGPYIRYESVESSVYGI